MKRNENNMNTDTKKKTNTLIANRLKQLRKDKQLSQNELAKELGVRRETVAQWERGENAPTRKLEELSRIFSVSTDYILGKKTDDHPTPKGVRIPVLGRVMAGIPIEAIQEILDYEEIPESMAKTGEFFALQVHGASMEPTLKEGDVVIVKKQPTADSGDIAIVLVNGNDATVKEIKESPSGITLIGHNVAVYTPKFYSNKEIEELPIQIIGKVVEMRRKF